MQKFQNSVDPEEEIAPGKKALVPRQPQILILGPERVKLVQMFLARQARESA